MGAFTFDYPPPASLVGPIVGHTHVHKDRTTDPIKYSATAYYIIAEEHELPGVGRHMISSWITSALMDRTRGWTRTGIRFVNVTNLPPQDRPTPFVSFQYLTDPACEGTQDIGCTERIPETGLAVVTLQANLFRRDRAIINHEAAHAWFSANHASPDSGSIMEPSSSFAELSLGPTAADIQTVKDWLASGATGVMGAMGVMGAEGGVEGGFVDTRTGARTDSLEELKGVALRARRERAKERREMRRQNERRFKRKF